MSFLAVDLCANKGVALLPQNFNSAVSFLDFNVSADASSYRQIKRQKKSSSHIDVVILGNDGTKAQGIKLICRVSKDTHKPISRLSVGDLSLQCISVFFDKVHIKDCILDGGFNSELDIEEKLIMSFLSSMPIQEKAYLKLKEVEHIFS